MHLQRIKVLIAILILTLSFINCNKNFGDLPPPGPKWRVFTKTTSPIIDNVVNAVSVDAQGIVWFGTNGGASSLQSTAWTSYVDPLTFLQFNPDETLHTVNSITNSSDGSTWFGLKGGGVRRFLPTSAGHQWTTYNSVNG